MQYLDVALRSIPILVSLITIVVVFFKTRRKDFDDAIEKNSKRVDAQEIRILSLEQTVASMPEKDDMHRMELAMEKITGKLDVVATHMSGQKDVMKRLENVVTRHEDHLLSGGKS
jgi:hypothetical protein